MKKILVFIIFFSCFFRIYGQDLPEIETKTNTLSGQFIFREATIISWQDLGESAAGIFKNKMKNDPILAKKGLIQADILFITIQDNTLGNRGFEMEVLCTQILIMANTETGFLNGINYLFELLPDEVASGNAPLKGNTLQCMEITGI